MNPTNPLNTCPTCKGLGDIRVGRSSNSIKVESCLTCHGTGKVQQTVIAEYEAEKIKYNSIYVPQPQLTPWGKHLMESTVAFGHTHDEVCKEKFGFTPTEGGKPETCDCPQVHWEHALDCLYDSAPVQAKPETNNQGNTTMNEQAAPSENQELTFGEKAVGLTFNPSGDFEVTKLKYLYAQIIDRLNDARIKSEDGEAKRLYLVAITEAQTAQMWAVKAATWKL